jgi:tetratricopeptide (TPR) repeat protein
MTLMEAAACKRAEGYLELGMPEEALGELEEAFASTDQNPAVLQLRTELLTSLSRWPEAAEICLRMIELDPGNTFWWIQGAYSVRRARSIMEAEIILREGLVHHPRNVLIVYNLACYACVQGQFDEAISLYGRAIALDEKTVFTMSLRDPDLADIHPQIIARFKGAKSV